MTEVIQSRPDLPAHPGIPITRLFKYIENFTSKNWKFSDKKNSDIFFWFLLKTGSNEYPQSMFSSKNKKKDIVYPCKPQFYYMYIKEGFKGVKTI